MTPSLPLVVVAEATPTPVQAYRDELYRFVLKRVRNEAAAEDIVQEALVKAYTYRETLKEPSRLRSWLYQIIRHTIFDHYRGQRPTEPVPDDLLPADASEEGCQAGRELAGCLAPLLDGIPAAYREALRLADIEGVTQQDVAARLDLSLSGAKSRVQRARRMLRDSLLACCRVEQDRRGAVVSYEPLGKCDCCKDSCG
jgi:RNA polymerase sigma-70 factor (ECF subfamily)